MFRTLGRFALLASLILLAAPAAPVRADTTVYLAFAGDPPPNGQGLPLADRNAIKAKMEAKYAFVPNIHFTLTPPANTTPNVFQIDFRDDTDGPYGDSRPLAHRAWVNYGKFLRGALRNFFDTPEKKINGMSDTACHELGHLFGIQHNKHAPADMRVARDADGNNRKRKPGDGVLIGGRPGLMADGGYVLPDETAEDNAGFAAGEMADIITFINNLKNPPPPVLDPRRGNAPAPKSLKTIRGLRADPDVPTPQFVDPFPAPRACGLVNIDVQLNNMPGYEFGYIALDGGFRALLAQGVQQGAVALVASTTMDFAVHQIGAPLSQRASFTEGSFLPQTAQPVNPVLSVEPTVAQPYFRAVQLFFDHDHNPGTPPAIVMLFVPDPDIFDGLLPVPGCPADFNNTFGTTVQDIFDFLAAWFAGTPTADFNGTTTINVQDIFDFLAAWFAGCA